MSYQTQILLMVPFHDDNVVNIQALKQYWYEEGGGESCAFIGDYRTSPTIVYAVLHHCDLHAFLPFARSLPWLGPEEVQLFIKCEDAVLFKDYGSPSTWKLPYDPHVDEEGLARRYETWPGVEALRCEAATGRLEFEEKERDWCTDIPSDAQTLALIERLKSQGIDRIVIEEDDGTKSLLYER